MRAPTAAACPHDGGRSVLHIILRKCEQAMGIIAVWRWRCNGVGLRTGVAGLTAREFKQHHPPIRAAPIGGLCRE
jgi:hypothetical protein